MEPFFLELSLIIFIAAILGLLSKALKQPLILAYLIAGVLVGPSFFNILHSEELTNVFFHVGLAFLLFIIGLSLDTRILREVGKIALLTGIGQIVLTTTLGFFIGLALGFSPVVSLYIAIAISFSSSIIIIKLLSDKNQLDTLYGKITIGFLIIQDFISIGILILLSGLSSTFLFENFFIDMALKFGMLISFPILFNLMITTNFVQKHVQNQELLFLGGVSWCFFLALVASLLGFSIEVGAFLAGISLASIPYHFEIANKIKPIRDFFIIVFFVVLGSQFSLASVGELLIPAIIFSVFILIGNPLIIMGIMGSAGYKKRTSLFSGLTVAQISEFSLIVLSMGFVLGHISQQILSMVTLIAIITIAGSSYMIVHNHGLYSVLSKHLGFFERKKTIEKKEKKKKYDAVLVGHHEMGYSLLSKLQQDRKKVLVVDFNPHTVKYLRASGIDSYYGDVSDEDAISKIHAADPQMIISTVPVYEDTITFLKHFKHKKHSARVFVTSKTIAEALELYKHGADFVFIPNFLGGEKASAFIDEFLKKKTNFEAIKKNQLSELMKYRHWQLLSK